MVLFCVMFGLLPLMTGCKSAVQKRITRDIIGINEQLYDLEKHHGDHDRRLRALEKIAKGTGTKDPGAADDRGKSVEAVSADGVGVISDPGDIYKGAYRLFLEKNYQGAAEGFSALTERFKADAVTDNALYWEAESHMLLNRPDRALMGYRLIYRYFPFSDKADHALFKIGLIYMGRGNDARALSAFTRLTNEYPDFQRIREVAAKVRQLKNRQLKNKTRRK